MALPANLPPVPGPPNIQLNPVINSNFNTATGILTVGAKQYNISIGNTGYNSLDWGTQGRVDEFVRLLLNSEELKQTLAGTRTPADTIRSVVISKSPQNIVSAEVIRANVPVAAASERIDIPNARLYTVCADVQNLYQNWLVQQHQPVQPQQPHAPAPAPQHAPQVIGQGQPPPQQGQQAQPQQPAVEPRPAPQQMPQRSRQGPPIVDDHVPRVEDPAPPPRPIIPSAAALPEAAPALFDNDDDIFAAPEAAALPEVEWPLDDDDDVFAERGPENPPRGNLADRLNRDDDGFGNVSAHEEQEKHNNS
jgi:hypothetical protein